MEGEQETAPKLLNDISFNDLERPLSQFSRSRYYSTSTTRKQYKIELQLQWRTNRKSYNVHGLSIRTAPFSMTLKDPIPRLNFKARLFFDVDISKMAADTAKVTMEGEQETAPKLLNGISFNDLESFQGHDIIQRQITRKWYKIELYSYNGGLIESHTWYYFQLP